MKVALIGNCQVAGLAEALRNSGLVKAEAFLLAPIRTAGRLDVEADRLVEFDWIVVQSNEVVDAVPEYARFRLDRLRETSNNVISIPSILYTGFHPDCTAIAKLRGGSIRTPAGEYSSIIIAAAFLLELAPERACRLFNSFIYRHLGYFEEAGKSLAFWRSERFAHGMDLRDSIVGWLARGVPFMHTMNHPVAFALEGVAKLIAGRLGVPADSVSLVRDELAASTIWPVYPELARNLKCEGSLKFKPAGSAKLIDLREMVDGSYEAYGKEPEAVQKSVVVKRAADTIRQLMISGYA